MKKLITLISLTITLLTFWACYKYTNTEGFPHYSYLVLIDTQTGKKTYLDRYDGYIKNDITPRFIANSTTDIVVMYRGAIKRYNLDENTKNVYNFEEENSTLNFYNYYPDRFIFYDLNGIHIYDYNCVNLFDYNSKEYEKNPILGKTSSEIFYFSYAINDSLYTLYSMNTISYRKKKLLCIIKKKTALSFIGTLGFQKEFNNLYFSLRDCKTEDMAEKEEGIYKFNLENFSLELIVKGQNIYGSYSKPTFNQNGSIGFINGYQWGVNEPNLYMVRKNSIYCFLINGRFKQILQSGNFFTGEHNYKFYKWNTSTGEKEPAIAGFYSQDMSKVITIEQTVTNHKTLFGENK